LLADQFGAGGLDIDAGDQRAVFKLHYAKDLGRSLLRGQQPCAQEQAESQHDEPFARIHLFVLLLDFRQNIQEQARIVPIRTLVPLPPEAGIMLHKGMIIKGFPREAERTISLKWAGIFSVFPIIQIIE
jgi:hypothetical protein